MGHPAHESGKSFETSDTGRNFRDQCHLCRMCIVTLAIRTDGFLEKQFQSISTVIKTEDRLVTIYLQQ